MNPAKDQGADTLEAVENVLFNVWVNMENQQKKSDADFRRFDQATYDVARKKELDALPLLGALESSRAVASGVAALLSIIRSQGAHEHNEQNLPNLFSDPQMEDILSLCITSLDLLNTKIEAVADLLSVRHEPD